MHTFFSKAACDHRLFTRALNDKENLQLLL